MSAIEWRSEWKPIAGIFGALLVIYHFPLGNSRFETAILEAFHLLKW